MTQQMIFQHEVTIDAPLAHVWQLVATEEGLRQWWGNRISLEAQEGGRCEEWRIEQDRTAYWRGVVTLYTPPYELVLTLRTQDSRPEEPELTTIAIALEAKGEQTRVHVTQRAFGSSAAIGEEVPAIPGKQPSVPQSVPLAQLVRPAPGSLPASIFAPQPSTGQIDPAYHLLTRQHADALTANWQRRLTALMTIAL